VFRRRFSLKAGQDVPERTPASGSGGSFCRVVLSLSSWEGSRSRAFIVISSFGTYRRPNGQDRPCLEADFYSVFFPLSRMELLEPHAMVLL
jgi:hypothetical protein